MRVRRRLTALIASLLLLPSLVTAGQGCVTRVAVSPSAPGVAAAPAEHDHASHSQHEAPDGLRHAPMQCVSVAACTLALVVAPPVQLTGLPRHGEQVVVGVMLAPASPARAPEPPPPRA